MPPIQYQCLRLRDHHTSIDLISVLSTVQAHCIAAAGGCATENAARSGFAPKIATSAFLSCSRLYLALGCQQFRSLGAVPGLLMPVPREEAVLPSDALVIKQVLDSMVDTVMQNCMVFAA